MSAIFQFHNQNNSTSSPEVFSVNGALIGENAAFWRHFLVKHKILPNLVIVNWLWWIKRALLANQNRENILIEE